MKKIIITASVLGALASTSAFAKTEGNYVGVDLLNTNISPKGENSYENQKENQVSLGASYKYAFNFNNFFVAPGAFLDYSNASSKDADNDPSSLDYRYGLKVDLGYDIVDKFAVFANIGIANNHYTVDWKSVEAKKSGSDSSVVYGIGAKYSVLDNVDLNLGYDLSKFSMTDPASDKQKFDVKVVRFGASYKF